MENYIYIGTKTHTELFKKHYGFRGEHKERFFSKSVDLTEETTEELIKILKKVCSRLDAFHLSASKRIQTGAPRETHIQFGPVEFGKAYEACRNERERLKVSIGYDSGDEGKDEDEIRRQRQRRKTQAKDEN